MRGVFITFEGPDGGGKSTQLELLQRYLEGKGISPLCLREPGATIVSERIRSLVLDGAIGELTARTEALLFCAARAELVAQRIRPALEAGEVILCDRFADSTLAYQGHGLGLPLAELASVVHFATGGLKPDLTFCFDIPAEEGLSRSRKAGKLDRIESLDIAFHERVRQGFLQLAAQEPERWRIIDARQAPEVIAVAVRHHVDAALKEAITR